MSVCRLALAVALLAPLAAPAQEAPAALVARAIAAHGGSERLSQVRADRTTLKGQVFVGKTALAFTSRQALQLPGQFKSVVEVTAGTRTRTVVTVLDGERAAVTVDGVAQPETAAAQVRRTLALEEALRLVPLLDARRYTLQPGGEYNLEGRTVVGVAVQGGAAKGLKLFFDRETAVLMAAEHTLDGPAGPVVQQARYSQHRDVGGCLRPGRITVYKGGEKAMEAELVECRRESRIDPAEFRIP